MKKHVALLLIIIMAVSIVSAAGVIETKKTEAAPKPYTGPFVGSKNSNVYHYPWCPSAHNIKPGNLVTFPTLAKAKAAAYRPCQRCHPPS